MSNDTNPTAALLDAVFEPFGDYAPKKRWVIIDFKGPGGEDRNINTYLYCDRAFTEAMIIQVLKDQITSEGGRLSAVSEVIEDEAGHQTGRCLYCAPGFLEETMRERGLPFPEDMKTAAEAAGFHPINWDELVREWEGK